MNRRQPKRRLAHESAPKTAALRQLSRRPDPTRVASEDLDDRSQTALPTAGSRKRCLAAGLMTGAIACGVLAGFTPRYETNDDAGMNAIAAGRMLVDRPDEHLLFSNVLIGLALKGLYRAAPSVPWYGGYLFFVASLSLAAICFVCLRRGASLLELCLTSSFLCLAGAPFLIVLQFTRVAFLATMAGLLLLAGTVRDGAPARQAAWSIPFLIAGSLIRFESFLLACLVLSPMVLWMLWRARSDAGARVAVAVLAGAIALGFGFVGFNNWYYARDEAWRGFYKFNALRAAYTDFGRGAYNGQTKPVFASVGWTQADVEMLRNWCFLDRQRFNSDTLQTVLDGLASREHATEPRPWSGLFENFFAESEVLALWTCGAIFLIALANARSTRFVPAGCFVVTSALCIYLYRDLHLPARVFCPAFAACAVVTLALSAGLRTIGKDKPWNASALAQAGIAAALGALLLWRGAGALRENRTFLAVHGQATDLMRHLHPRPDQLFVVWGAEFPYEALTLPLESETSATNFKVLGLGSLAATPFSAARLREFDVSDLYSMLRRRRGIFFITNRSENGTLALYIREHYGVKIGGALVLAHPALGEAAVYSLAITGLAPGLQTIRR
jgi:hypothetical protein